MCIERQILLENFYTKRANKHEWKYNDTYTYTHTRPLTLTYM